MSGWAKVGWDSADEYTEYGNDGTKQYGTRKFWMPPSSTKRILFLDSDSFGFHEHGMWVFNKSSDRHICLERNTIDKRGCPLCNADLYPYFISYFTIINMGDVITDSEGKVKLEGYHSEKTGRVYQFQKELYGAKRGSKDKPGTFKQLKRLAEKRGKTLVGTVWDVYRSGAGVSNVGDEFDFIEKVAEQDWEEYLVGEGADREELQMIGLVPFDYVEEFKPKTYEELEAIVYGKTPSKEPQRERGAGVRTEGAGFGGNPGGGYKDGDDDGIPF